jgi:putative membrane protein
MASLLMWMPVVGPFRELHLSPIGKCVYLFLQSIVPTIPAAWLTFAEGAVYSVYDQPVRVWGIDVTTDQQIAGAIMKIGGGIFLWTLIVYIFFRRVASSYASEHDYRRGAKMPTAEIVGNDNTPLTTKDIEREFASSPPSTD